MMPLRPGLSWLNVFNYILIASLLVSGCSPAIKTAEPATPAPVAEAATSSAATTPTAAAVPATAVPRLPSATLAPSPSPTPAGPQLSGLKPISPETLNKPETYHNAFLFIAKDYALSGREGFRDPNMPSGDGDELWLIRPEQQQAARISPQGFSTAIYQPANGKVKLISYQTPAEKALIKALGWEEVLAPELCRLPADGSKPAPDFARCKNLRFSADGRFLVYEIPVNSCSNQVRILNLEKRMHVVSQKERGHWSLPLADGSFLYALGHCEGGEIVHFDPATGKSSIIGGEADLQWNQQQTAFVAEVGDERGSPVEFWGYNSDTNQLFVHIQPWTNREIDENPVWTPDGKAVLYQHMAYTRDSSDETYTFDRPMEIFQVDIATRKQTKVATDSKYNYRIGAWVGDFLLLKRYSFEVMELSAERVYGLDNGETAESRCLAYGYEEDCGKPDLFGYNYKTGELMPWDKTGQAIPEQKPNEIEPGPNPSIPPFYEAKDGSFRLAFGYSLASLVSKPSGWWDQMKGTLWMAPKNGQPEAWVDLGWSFILLP